MAASFLRRGFPMHTGTASNPYATSGQWLLGVGGMVVSMIHVGGLTRLTQSGLSMTTWSPVGSLPPLSAEEWRVEFARYQQYPEYQQRKSMTIADFQYIYWWEYGHRMLGRMVGVAFCVPWLVLGLRGRIPPGYHPRLAALGTMGATQGVVGWWMVKSGLGDDRRGDRNEIRVKPVRLATHLSMAMATYAGLVWTAMDIFQFPNGKEILDSSSNRRALQLARKVRNGGIALTCLAATTIVSGAFVAGNDAGRAFNSFPKMNNEWIPSEMWDLQPWYKNLMENTATVQWNHRVLGTATAITGISVAALALRQPHLLTPQLRRAAQLAGGTVAAQFTLGVTTLLYYVPISLAAAHQMGSVAVLTSGLYLVHSARYARPTMQRLTRAVGRVQANTG